MKKSLPKVCHLSSVHYAFDSRIFYREAKALAKYFDVTIIAFAEQDFKEKNLNILAIPKPLSRVSRFLLTIPRVFFKALGQKADLYHFHDPELIPIGLLLRLLGKKVIFDIHENIKEQIKIKPWLPLRNWIAELYSVFDFIAAKSFYLILSEESYRQVYDRRCPEDRLAIIQNFAPVDVLTPYVKLNRPKAPIKLFYIGTIDEVYCFFEIVEAIWLLRERNIEAHLDFVGWLDPKLKQQLQALPYFEAIKSQLTFHGFQRTATGFSHSTTCQIGLCPVKPVTNGMNSYPRKMFEYMAVGLPVITSNFPLYKAVVKRHDSGLCINPESPEAIADAIAHLSNNPELAEQMGKNGTEAVQQDYSWEQEEKKLIHFYKQILAI